MGWGQVLRSRTEPTAGEVHIDSTALGISPELRGEAPRGRKWIWIRDAFFDGVSRTLSARYHKDGSEILVNQGNERRPRRLTPRECARLMGFPDNFGIPVSDTQSYRQFGNSVVAPVMAEVARIMKPHVLEIKADRHARSRRSA